MLVETEPQLCFLKMTIEVHFAHDLWYIILPNPLHSSFTRTWPGRYRLRCNSARIWAPRFPLALLSVDERASISFRTRLSPAHLGLNYTFYIEFRTVYPTPPPLSALLRLYGRSSNPTGAPQTALGLLSLDLAFLNHSRRSSD